MVFPSDLLIFSPSPLTHQPWANRVRGGSTSSASSIVIQYTAWVVRMSLPMSWKSAGQRFFQSPSAPSGG